jgi:DNA-binding NarL/FixJ family response regulator
VAELSELEATESVGQAGDAGQVLESVRQSTPDVVILDGCITGPSGPQVLALIKASIVAPVVVVLSRYPCPQCRARHEQPGADLFGDIATEIHCVAEVIAAVSTE